jgi:hypothetical protein
MGCKKNKKREEGKGLVEPCLVCGENRFTDQAHFPKRKRQGEEGTETIPLCPTHHKLLDNGRLSRLEFEEIWKNRFAQWFTTVEEFVEWAFENCYPYNIIDMRHKFWDYLPLQTQMKLFL